MPSDPMEALKKTSSIGPGPLSQVQNRLIKYPHLGDHPDDRSAEMPSDPSSMKMLLNAVRHLKSLATVGKLAPSIPSMLDRK